MLRQSMLDKFICYCMKRTSSTCGTRVGTRKRESLKTYPRASGAGALAPQRTWKECKIRFKNDVLSARPACPKRKKNCEPIDHFANKYMKYHIVKLQRTI